MFGVKKLFPEISRNHLKHPAVLMLTAGLVFVFFASIYNNVFAKPDVPVSRMLFSYGGELYNIKTTEKDVFGAVKKSGLNLYKQDKFSIDPNTKLNGQSLQFSITKSWPIMILDDEKRVTGRTSSSEINEILKQNDIIVSPEDRIDLKIILDPAKEEAVGPILKIKRAPEYTIYVDDSTKLVKSWGATIKDVIKDKVELGPRDLVEPPLESLAVPQDIIITRINIVEIEETASIDFPTIYQDDYYTNRGINTIITAGKNGAKKQIFKVTYKNGKEVSKILLSEVVTQNPVKQVIKRGLRPTDDNYNRWPVLVAAGVKYGVSPSDMYKVMMCESKGYQYAGQNGAYKGIFQWDGSFYGWAEKAGFSGADIFDVSAQAYATALRVSKQGWIAWGCKP